MRVNLFDGTCTTNPNAAPTPPSAAPDSGPAAELHEGAKLERPPPRDWDLVQQPRCRMKSWTALKLQLEINTLFYFGMHSGLEQWQDTMSKDSINLTVPWIGVRKFARHLVSVVERLTIELHDAEAKVEKLGDIARNLLADAKEIQAEHQRTLKQLEELGGLSISALAKRRSELEAEVGELEKQLDRERASLEADRALLKSQTDQARQTIVETRETALLQEVGIYDYRHPLTDAVAYENALSRLQDAIKAATKKDGGAIEAATNWEVNGSKIEGAKIIRDISKLMLRAFNAEADTLIRGLKPYKLDSAKERLRKVEGTIKRLGEGMQIRISPTYYQLRVDELELTADFLQKQAEEKEVERQERERMREERKAQQEIERERAKLEKEKQHYVNALETLTENGDEEAAARLREQLSEVDKAIETVESRAANTRAGYVYVISNIGSFGESMVKVGMTRRLDPMDRIRELSDASVPFNFDVHALFFSSDAVGIETAMHDRLAGSRVNSVNRRREFFRATPLELRSHLSELTGELLEFREVAEAIEYRQTLGVNNYRDSPASAAA